MKSIKLVKIIAFAIYGICAVALIVFGIPQTGLKAKTVLTGSMTPTIPRGSLVLIQYEMPSQLNKGDVITYKRPTNLNQTITHRITRKEIKQGITFFVTRGDANSAYDPEIPSGYVLGKVFWHIPWVGFLIEWLKGWIGLILLILIPGLIIIIDELRRLGKALYGHVDKEPNKAAPAVQPIHPQALPSKPPVNATRPVPPPTTSPTPRLNRRPARDGVIDLRNR